MEPRHCAARVYTLVLEVTMNRTLIVLCALIASSCAGATEPASKPASPRGIAPPTRIPYTQPADSPGGEAVATSAMPRGVRRAVVADAARRFKVSESAVVLAHAEQLTWSDGSLGCPQPGQMYTQALVPGFRVVASTPEGDFLYHTDSHGQVLVCGPPERL
jgi:hypothetical protein